MPSSFFTLSKQPKKIKLAHPVCMPFRKRTGYSCADGLKGLKEKTAFHMEEKIREYMKVANV